MAVDRKNLKQRISIGFAGLSRMGKGFSKEGRGGGAAGLAPQHEAGAGSDPRRRP
jgi:hypothetical protein